MEDRRRRLQAARHRRYGRHEVIFHQGDPDDTLHLIAEGRVAVPVATPLGDTTTLTVLEAGQFFGELAWSATNRPVSRPSPLWSRPRPSGGRGEVCRTAASARSEAIS
jgi:CRP/FNR family cyclic AMP-dependent transcriptional regulator